MAFTIFFTLPPIAVFTFLIKKFRKLQDKQLSSRFKILYERLELKKGIIVLIQPIFFLLRRLILTLSVVLLDQTLIWQVMLLYFQVIVSIIIISYIEVEKTIYRQSRREKILNELMLLMTMYACLCFSEWLPEPKIRFNISYGLIGSLFLSIAIILAGILGNSFFATKRKIRIWMARR